MPAGSSLVSVVIPSYGRPKRIKNAVASVRAQTHPNIELVVVDDASPTPICPSVEKMDLDRFNRVVCVCHQENRGAAAARVTGINEASGEFVAFLDDDDEWHESKLERQVQALSDAPDDVGVVYTGMKVVDADGNTIRTHTTCQGGDLTRALLCENVVGSFSAVMVRASVITEAGLPDSALPSWQDLDWYVRLSQHCEFRPVNDPLTVIYQDEAHEQISDNFEATASVTYPRFLEKHREVAAGYGPVFERKMIGWAKFRVGAYYALRMGLYSEARRYLLSAVKSYPFEPVFWFYLVIAGGGRLIYDPAKRIKRSIL